MAVRRLSHAQGTQGGDARPSKYTHATKSGCGKLGRVGPQTDTVYRRAGTTTTAAATATATATATSTATSTTTRKQWRREH